jgi:glycosyltransferase involved in cell wall biosynthesis
MLRSGRLRVVALVDHLVPYGGAERLVAEIAMRLDQSRFEPIVCATRTVDVGVASQLERCGVRVELLGRKRRFDVRDWRPLFDLLRERDAVLHTHKFGSNVWGSVVGRLARVPVIAHEHVWSYEDGLVRRWLDRFVASQTALFLTVSDETRRQMIEIEHIPPTHVAVFRHGVASAPVVSRSDARRRSGLSEGTFVVSTVCVLRPQKALQTLVAAVPAIVAQVPDCRFIVVGDGSERARLESLAADLSVTGYLDFVGAQRDVADYVAAADVCVNTSLYEGSPLAVMEYMAQGRPIVATAVGGVPELLDGGRAGILIDAADPAALADAVIQLAADAGLREQLGAAARVRQLAMFDLDANILALESLYEKLAAARGIPRRRLLLSRLVRRS